MNTSAVKVEEDCPIRSLAGVVHDERTGHNRFSVALGCCPNRPKREKETLLFVLVAGFRQTGQALLLPDEAFCFVGVIAQDGKGGFPLMSVFSETVHCVDFTAFEHHDVKSGNNSLSRFLLLLAWAVLKVGHGPNGPTCPLGKQDFGPYRSFSHRAKSRSWERSTEGRGKADAFTVFFMRGWYEE